MGTPNVSVTMPSDKVADTIVCVDDALRIEGIHSVNVYIDAQHRAHAVLDIIPAAIDMRGLKGLKGFEPIAMDS